MKCNCEQIRKLRMDGLSLSEIASKLGVSKSTCSIYCSGLRPNNKPRSTSQIASDTNRRKWLSRADDIRQAARAEWLTVKNNHKILSMVAFYWGEGDKRVSCGNTKGFGVTNSDPGIIKIVIDGLDELGIGADRIRAVVAVFPEQDAKECLYKWREFTGVETRTILRKWTGRKHKIYSKYGLCKLRVTTSFEIYHKVMTWIQCWRESLGIFDGCQV